MNLTMTNKITQKLVGPEEERAVSPVIGVILMVAITVILAAVIAAFVLDIGPGEADPSASISHDQGNNEVTVELQSLDGNADAVVVVDDDGENFVPYDSGEDDSALTVSGEEETFDGDDAVDDADVDGGTIQAISVSDTDDLNDGIDNLDDVESNAILVNLDD